jgi:hypothetical protein
MMNKTLIIICFSFLLCSCVVEHEEQDLVVKIIENPDDMRGVLLKKQSGRYYIDSVESKYHNLHSWSTEFRKMENNYSIESYGYWFRKEKYKLFFDEKDSSYSKIVVKSPSINNEIEFIFRKDKGTWVLLAIYYSQK